MGDHAVWERVAVEIHALGRCVASRRCQVLRTHIKEVRCDDQPLWFPELAQRAAQSDIAIVRCLTVCPPDDWERPSAAESIESVRACVCERRYHPNPVHILPQPAVYVSVFVEIGAVRAGHREVHLDARHNRREIVAGGQRELRKMRCALYSAALEVKHSAVFNANKAVNVAA